MKFVVAILAVVLMGACSGTDDDDHGTLAPLSGPTTTGFVTPPDATLDITPHNFEDMIPAACAALKDYWGSVDNLINYMKRESRTGIPPEVEARFRQAMAGC